MTTREFQQKIKAVSQVNRGIAPDPAWILRTRQTLLMQVRNSMPVGQASWIQTAKQMLRAMVPARLVALTRAPALATLSIFGMVLGGSIASVSAAERSLPGDFLYPVKLVTEQTRLVLTKDKTEKLKLKTEFVGRRMDEIKTLVNSDGAGKSQRVKEAAVMLKQDLDTVKNQLNDASQQEPADQVAQAARLIDQKSDQLVTDLKSVKASLPDDAQASMADAVTAAVNTGVKAVQIIVDAQSKPDAQQVVSRDELVQSINSKLQGMADNITDATQKLLTAPTSTAGGATTTLDGAGQIVSTSTAATQISAARVNLEQVKQLLQDNNKMSEVSDKLTETANAVAGVDRTVNAVTAAVSSTVTVVEPVKSEGAASSTTSTPAMIKASSTQPVLPSATTTVVMPAATSSSSTKTK